MNYETESSGHNLLTPDFSKQKVEIGADYYYDYGLILFIITDRLISYK